MSAEDHRALLTLLAYAKNQAALYVNEIEHGRREPARAHMDELRAYLREATAITKRLKSHAKA